MTIAELFINLGVKGTGETAKSLSSVKTGLKDVGSVGLATKAAIFGVVYGLQRLTGMVSERGMDLKKFGDLTGLSTDKLQRWQYAAMQSGVRAEEMASSIQAVQGAMTNMLLGKGAPEGMNMLASVVNFDASKARDTFYVMDKLQEFAKKTKDNPDVANAVMRSFGLSDATIQMMRTSKVELDKIKPSNIFSEKEIQQLARVEVAWMNFWNGLKMFWGHLVSKHGMEGIQALQNSFKFLTDVANNVDKLIKKFPQLQTVMVAAGVAIAAVWAPITTSIAGLIYLLSEYQKSKEGKKSIFSKDGAIGQLFDFDNAKKDPGSLLNRMFKSFFGDAPAAIPNSAPQAPNTNNKNTKVIINNYGVKDAQEAGQLFKRQINNAVEQNPARTQGS